MKKVSKLHHNTNPAEWSFQIPSVADCLTLNR